MGYFVPVARDRRDNFLVTAGLSGVLGYETVNRGGKRLYDGATLVSGNGFVYGGEIALRGEAYLCDRVALLLTLRERIVRRPLPYAAGKPRVPCAGRYAGIDRSDPMRQVFTL